MTSKTLEKTQGEIAADEVQQPAAPPPPMFTLLLELEDIPLHGRQAAFEVLKQRFGQKFTLSTFVQYCLKQHPNKFIPALAETFGEGKSADGNPLDVYHDAVGKKLLAAAKLPPALVKIIELGKDLKISTVVVSALPRATAEELMEKSGLTALGARLLTFESADRLFPTPDVWLKAAKGVGQKALRCAVLGGSARVCKTALSADMRCIAAPDEYTSFQDFAGVAVVLEKLDDLSAREILEILFPLHAAATK